MQGCNCADDLARELGYALEDAVDRFTPNGVDPAQLDGQDAPELLAGLGRTLGRNGTRLLVLIDEPEVLLGIAEQEPERVAALDSALRSGNVRTVLASTKLLAALQRQGRTPAARRFLDEYAPSPLHQFDDRTAQALMRQEQSPEQVRVEESVAAAIRRGAGGHPYLLQYLCNRLFEAGDDGCGRLRPVHDADCVADQLLAGYLQIDMEHLSSGERALLGAVVQRPGATAADLVSDTNGYAAARVHTSLAGLAMFGYVREASGAWQVGNEFLRRWLVGNTAPSAHDVAPREGVDFGDILFGHDP
jgi:hypothetical protein